MIIRDISDRREVDEASRRSVLRDHLTGLANRRAFFDAAEPEIRRWLRAPRPLSIVVFDVDNFEAVVDTFGHAGGDAILLDLAASLAATFRAVDVLARISTEAFVVLLPETGLEGAAAVAQRLRERVAAANVAVDGASIRHTVSAGIATMDASVVDLDALLERATDALCSAKAKGRNRVEIWSADPARAAPESLGA